MNPDQIAHQVRRLLDASADNLPPHILARLEAARGQALSRLDARHPHTAHPTSWAGWSVWPAWARLGLAAVPVVLVATLLALPSLDPAAPDGQLSAGHTSASTAQQVANSQTPNAPATTGQREAEHAQAPITAQAPQTAEAPEASEALDASAALAAATTDTPANPLTAPQDAEPPLIVYRHAFTRPPDMSIPVVFPHASGFTRSGFGTPVSFTLPMTPNPTPPLSSFDPPPP